jgi:site-specific DNA-methyltransferase (adenine-specific)
MSDRWAVHHGDCREVMRTLDAESIDSIVTDPPYGLGFMGKGWDHGVPGVEFWTEALRIAKPGAHLLAFGGTRTYHRLAVAIEDAGWEIRDCVMWVYGSGFPKSHDVSKAIDREAGAEREVVGTVKKTPSAGGDNTNDGWVRPWAEGKTTMDITAPATEAARQWQGWGTALKPAYEPIIVARKPLRGTVAGNVLQWGTGGINVDGCRIDGEPWKPVTATGLGSVKFFTEGDTPEIEKHPHAPGRWPANFIHDGSEEVTGLLGDAARFFYCAKASKRDRDEGCEGMEERHNKGSGTHGNGTASTRLGNATERAAGITHVELQKVRNHHPTVKPTDLMRYLCRLVTPPDGLVLDPFTGSGSTGKAAMLEGFRFVGCELSAEYIEIARARIGHAAGQSRQKELALA